MPKLFHPNRAAIRKANGICDSYFACRATSPKPKNVGGGKAKPYLLSLPKTLMVLLDDRYYAA
jgi:hypothetical protein